jgi:hypothetical protein
MPLPEALRRLAALRARLRREQSALKLAPGYLQGLQAHLCCTRARNQMRITPLEARAIGLAFRSIPALRRKLSDVLRRLSEVLPSLEDTEDRQNFDCPLLDGERCLVHRDAKPIGCLAWHPPPRGAKSGRDSFTELGWKAFDLRDALNDAVEGGTTWPLRVIPIWLAKVFEGELGGMG